ncbi:hypothetical protein PYH69_11470 [Mammaliicoccus lentus]|uniref:Uncharacterized protein n=1 Tax=Mammaliicoccus lentus TaxID=42858 RepID=A0AAX3W1T1_MAMLE|nr:hypothetical protein [Mammaliicoccus lentus]WHI59330.1 hypothetical protein PYH69_11470 [Mammaliicoccus lentus]
MKLEFRDFYYLDQDAVDSYLGHFEGFISDEIAVTTSNQGNKGFKAKTPIVDGSISSNNNTETYKKGRTSYPIKFNQLMNYLIENDLDQINYMNKDLWDMIIDEGEILECKGTLKLPQAYSLFNDVMLFSEIGPELGIPTEEVSIVSSQINSLKKLISNDGFPIVMEIDGEGYKFITYLNEKFLMKNSYDIVGFDYKILCKVLKIIPKGSEYEMYNLKNLEKKYVNREQRRKNKQEKLPIEFQETMKGPGCVVLPIAIYR